MATSESTGRTCVFCGKRGDLTGEHLIPAWVGRVLPDVGKGLHERTKDGKTHTWHAEGYDRKAGIVCEDCNTGWMSRIEGAIKPLGEPLVLGKGRTLSPPKLRRLASWAFFRALIGAARAPTMPHEPYAYFYGHRKPSPRTKVWLGAYALGPHQHYFSHVPLWIDVPQDRSPANGYMVTFSIGYLAFHVFGNETGKAHQHSLGTKFPRAFTQIWPVPRESVRWPPELFVSIADLDLVTNFYV